MSVAIIDYGSGNLHSAAKAFERAAAKVEEKAPIVVTSDPHVVLRSSRIVLPGVGAFADCRKRPAGDRRHGRSHDRSRSKTRRAIPRDLRRHAIAGGAQVWSMGRRLAWDGFPAKSSRSSLATQR